ncbi:MAG TPA: DUF2764 family protein [Spirochaetia bacterium]|nr:DUF2764 family protein [Spirochaetia bacterium]
MRNQYYFLAASLEDVSWGHGTTRGTLEDLIEYLNEGLAPEDAAALKQLFLFNDMRNAVSLNDPDSTFVTPSCYDREALLEAAQGDAAVLPFLLEYFEGARRSAGDGEKSLPIDELSLLFYDRIDDISDPFVRDYFVRELNMRNLTIALSRESQGFPYRERLVPRGDAYTAIMSGSPPDFGLSADYPFVEDLIRVFRTTDLTAQEELIEKVRWQWLDDRVSSEFFSTDFILSYVIKYQSVERWQTLSEEKGDELFGELLNSLRRSVRFSLEFSDVGDKQNDGRTSNRDQQ